MTEEFLGDRKKALEETFFAKYNAQLLADLKRKDALKARREALAEVSGIEDAVILDRLVELNIEGETLAALTLIPLIEVAWADGSLDARERKAILQAATQQGIGEESPAYGLLGSWLDRIPDRKLLTAWKAYVGELTRSMTAEEKEKLKTELLSRAQRVARAAGGFLGFDKVSENEERVLRDLESSF